MRQLLNTLFVTSEDIYLSLDGENVVANRGGEQVARYPLHTLQSILSFSYSGASPALMGACAERDVSLAFCTPRGRFLARVTGQTQGNVLLRRKQYRETTDRLRGLEGSAAVAYFSILDERILQSKDTFFFTERSRRPPLDAFNALLSFAYSLLAHDCASALEAVGLDAYVGFLHRDRPGRESLALDLMEELRPCLADRFVLTMVNNRIIKPADFDFRESGAVFLTEAGRRTFLQKWQEHKKEVIKHPFLEEKIPWGMVPYVQSLLLARCLRGDVEDYPPFLWK